MVKRRESTPVAVIAHTVEQYGLSIVDVTGAIDIATVGEVAAELAAQLGRRPARLVIDLTRVSVIGSVGLSMLIAAHDAAKQSRVRFAVVATDRAVPQTLGCVGLDRRLPIHPTRAAAIEVLCGVLPVKHDRESV